MLVIVLMLAMMLQAMPTDAFAYGGNKILHNFNINEEDLEKILVV